MERVIMNRPMRLVGKSETTEICSGTGLHNRCFLCNLSGEPLRAFDAISLTGLYPRGVKLFAEGQRPRGVFVLCSGRAKLSIGSSNGRSLMRVAEQGEILGLSAALSGAPYDDSAEMLESGQVNFIRRDNLLNLLNGYPETGLHMAKHLSQAYMAVHEQMRALVLSDSAAEKLARLLLSWIEKTGRQTEHNISLKISLTHGEIAQMIGVSRETVTRLLGELRDKRIIQLRGSNLLIRNKAALEGMVNS
ncbi:MAG: Crp/Fnr family transcriptional regulator [Blastocatellia bacterium]|nr:Crp/Fnr family transcriptional regulator [Blastocatellia bacterium]